MIINAWYSVGGVKCMCVPGAIAARHFVKKYYLEFRSFRFWDVKPVAECASGSGALHLVVVARWMADLNAGIRG